MSVCAPYPEPLSISPRCDLLLPGSHFEAGGVEYGEARGPAAAPSRRTHCYAAAFPHALQSAFALEPASRATAGGETTDDDHDDKQTDRRQHTTDRDNETNTAAGQKPDNGQRSSRGRAQRDKTRRTEQKQAKIQHSKRQRQNGRRQASDTGRDRHPPRRVLHTPQGKASAAARVARRPHLHSAHLRAE